MAGKLVARGDVSPRIDTKLRGLTRIGAASDNDICVGGAGVASHHARLSADDVAFTIEAVAPAVVSINGARISRAPLQHLDVITLAPRIDLVFLSTDDSTSPDLALDKVTIEWLDGPDQGRKVDIPRGESMIGRAQFAAIVVDAPAISRAQARLSHTGDSVKLEDLGSPNGTFVGGQRIDRPVLLASGDIVTLGGVRRFRITLTTSSALPDPPARPATAPPVPASPATSVAAPPPAPPPAAVVDQEWRTRLDLSFGDLELRPPAVVLESGRARPPEPAPANRTVLDMKRPNLQAPNIEPPPMPAVPAGAPQASRTIFAAGGIVVPPALDGEPAGKPAITSVRLESAAGASFKIGIGTSTIGRAQNADVLINKPHISRIHAMLEVTRDQVTLRDGGSENGTDVNGERVASTRILNSGDRIGFAGEMFQIEIVRSKGPGGNE